MIAAILLIPVVGLAGLSLDYARVKRAESELQAGIDSALLAAAATGGSRASMEEMIRNFLAANLAIRDIAIRTNVDNKRMLVRANYRLPTPMLAFTGRSETAIVAIGELTSVVPLRNSGVSSQLTSRQMKKIMKEYGRYMDRMPPRLRQQSRAAMNAAGKLPGRGSTGYYLSR